MLHVSGIQLLDVRLDQRRLAELGEGEGERERERERERASERASERAREGGREGGRRQGGLGFRPKLTHRQPPQHLQPQA